MQAKGDIFLLNTDGSLNLNYDKEFYSHHLKCLKKYLYSEGFNKAEEDFVIFVFNKKWWCKRQYFKEYNTFRGMR